MQAPVLAMPAISQPKPAVRTGMALSECTSSSAQLFVVRKMTRPGTDDAIYQLQSFATKMCLSGSGFNASAITLSPCRDNDDLQLWLFRDAKQAAADTYDQMTIYEYATAAQIPNIEKRLGMARDTPVGELTLEEARTLRSIHPAALDVMEMVFRLCDFARTYVDNVWKSHQSGAVLVPNLIKLFLTPDEYPPAWKGTWGVASAILLALPLPEPFGILLKAGVRLSDSLIKDAEERSRPSGPTPADELAWGRFALEQSDVAADALYAGFTEVFKQSRIGQLRVLLKDFDAGKYKLNATEFYRRYQTVFLQQLLVTGNDTFWVTVCAANNEKLCKGKWKGKQGTRLGPTYDTWYASNIPKAGSAYLRDVLGEEDNFYKGTNGWKLVRYLYTCPGKKCKARLILRGGADGKAFERITASD
ncbi:hypothetical protein THASP1DRAFT_21962 [Thamnocephalis sphaerospora]|uniref:Uncharacterized protein n=1 Tax=Thamnocephalis sphaerospora TaxID=78915 RepID=A0A4P9XVL0_9FUNG|nr:hypothetical protein THASP1DRAFT_21962 [Thamnocephalis sphaerospora]|eukprot:RKP10313.1 hypothetical protein THASP1DRAFT_21962 [Thamnocephalis sphaerospora]